MRLLKLFFILAFYSTLAVKGQIGTKFWFAAPNVSYQHHQDSKPLNLHITALYNSDITISRPADPSFTPVEFNLGEKQTQLIRLDNLLAVDEIEVYERELSAGNFIQNKGFLIEADGGEITAYYELEGSNNTDIIALKSHNALGKDFWVSTQRKYKNHGYDDDFSGFVVVATKDGTTVNIDPNGNDLEYHGSVPFSVTLQRGETFAVRAAGQDPEDHIFGIHVTSNNDIAITIFDDSMQIDDGGGNWDIFADQLIPVSLIGKEYIVLKGEVQDEPANPYDGEAVFITPTEPNTDIYIDGAYVTTLANPGDYFSYDITNLSTHVSANKPIYVNHITGYSTNIVDGARELGGAVLPSIDNCTGSHLVTVKRTPAPGFVFFNNLMVRNDTTTGSPTRNQAIYNFTYSIDGGPSTAINPNHFTYIMDSAFAVYDRNKAGGAAYYNNVNDNEVLQVYNPIARFHLGAMQGIQSPGCKYGYFSDYAASDALVGIGGFTQGNSDIFCNLNPIHLVANGGTSYQWYAPFEPGLIDKLDYDTIADPYFFPDTTGIYYFDVIVTGECQTKDTLHTEVLVFQEAATNFTFSSDEGCSPFAPELTNLSDTVIGVSQVWTLETAASGQYQINQDTVPRTFELPLPENHTDSVQTHTLTLVVKGVFNTCPTRKSKDIKVKPQIKSDFVASDTIGCHPLLVDFTNLSTGHLDSTSYTWEFGDNSQSFEINPSKTYRNYGLEDSTYQVQLITRSPFDCMDTSFQNITVHPRVRAALSIENSNGCSPFSTTLNPENSIGADTLIWNVDYWYGDSIYKTDNKSIINLTHNDTSIVDGPDTLRINLLAVNRMGCRDSITEKQVVVYPEVNAQFSVDKDSICDSLGIVFTNNSTGYNLYYEWDFDEGTNYQTYSDSTFTKYFFNRSTNDITYNVVLQATSGYNCQSSFDTNIVVHPYIKAAFSADYQGHCSPLDATIYNNSVRVQNYLWDFGDGSPVSSTSASEFDHQFVNPLDDRDTTYTMKLIVENPEGCRDSIQRDIMLYPRVVADFDMTDPVGCNPLTVSFTNNSKGKDLMYDWEFGNISSSISDKNFDRTFSHYGATDSTFMVTLNTYNGMGCDSSISKPVTLYAYIDADFTIENADSCSPFDIRIENNSPAGVQHTYWSFGDGETSTQFEPEHRYTNHSLVARTDTLQLVVQNNHNCYDTLQQPVSVYPEINASFMLDTTRGCQPLEIAITNNTNILSGTDFNWDFGDNTTSAAQDPPDKIYTNTEPNSEYHTITLDAVSQYGCSDNTSVAVEVYPYIRAKFTIDKPFICSDEMFRIDRSSTKGGIDSYYWDYNGIDNSSRTDEIHDYTFANTGNSSDSKTITLTVSNIQGCDTSWSENILVHPEVRADFDIDTNEYCYPHVFSFTNTSNLDVATRHTWSFGDGSSSSETHPDHFFVHLDNEQDTQFDISLYAESDYGCNSSISKTITVHPKPKADFNFPVTVDCPPFTVPFTNSSRGTDLIYNWDFDNGNYSTDENPEETFNNTSEDIEEKKVQLIATTTFGCRDTLVKTISVYPQVSVDFEASEWEGCNPLTVSFDGTAANEYEHIWYVEGEAFSTLEDATHRFVNKTHGDKTFDVRYYARSVYNCMADTVKQVTVFPSPEAEFVPEPVLQDYNTETDITTVTMNNRTFNQENFSYTWDFGDGTSSSDDRQSLVKEYTIWGDINNKNQLPVKLVAWNANHPECTDTVIHHIIINPPLPEIDLADDISDCVPFTVDFSATTKYIYEDSYQWDFGFNSATSSATEPVFTYTEPGTYVAKLFVEGDGGLNWDYKKITVYPKPDVNFTFTPEKVLVESQITDPKPVKFFNHTEDGESFEWLFGDGDMSFEEEPSHIYRDTGLFNVTLIATTPFGCMDTLVHETPVYVYGEGKLIFPTAFMVDPAGPADEYYDPEDPDPYIFRPVASGVKEYNLSIYNRWGVLLFETDDVNRGWNGYIDGEMAKQDVYVWKVKARFTNGEPYVAAGDVTLFKTPAP